MTEGIKAEKAESILPREIDDEMKQSYLDYAMSVIVGRALPDVRDGLKPVHRRILYGMHDLGMLHNKPYKKSARIVGEILGKYHPHGDAAVYDALVRMAQDFSLRYPLVDGQGNWGSIDGDASAAMRYCVTGDSLIVTEKGLVRIEELSSQEDIDIKILSKDKKINKASKWFDSGYHDTLKITTNKGYSLSGSKNHPVLTLSKDETGKPIFVWQLLEKIQKGDFIVIDRSSDSLWPKEKIELFVFYPNIKKRTKVRILPKYLDEDLAFVLGSFISEGSLSENKIEFTNSDENWINLFCEIWAKIFPNSKLHKFKRKPNSYGKKEYYRLECHSKYTTEFLRNIGLNCVKSSGRQIPKLLLQSPKEVLMAFLKSYFEGDGSISYSRKMVELSCCSKSEKLIEELQILLLRFGIDSFKRFDKYKLIWKLYIRGYRNILRFYKEIGFISDYKNKKLEFVVYNYKKDSSLYDFVPFISDYIRSITRSEFVISNNFDRYTNIGKNYKRISSILLQKTKMDYTPLFEYLLTYNYLFDKVIQVEEAGIQKVYSIKVESNCHTFISNGFISHNTEARLSKIAEEMLQDIDKETVKFIPNFDGTLEEPTVLPSKLPNLLVNGSSGIAVGMATNIPPHNISEVCDGIIQVIDNPNINVQELLNSVKGPDFPTGAIIAGRQGISTAYSTGRGKITVRAKIKTEKVKNKACLIVEEIPYMINKAQLIEEIAELVNHKKITGISDIRDESDRDGMRIVFELKAGANADVIINQLYKHTRLEDSFGMIMLALVDNQPRILSLKSLITEFIKHRQAVIRKRTEFDLDKAEKKAHLLEGLLIALKNIDEIIRLIKKSKTVEDARKTLIARFMLSIEQSNAILEMKLQRLTSLEQEKTLEEHKELLKLIVDLKAILASEKKILDIIKKEMRELKEKYGDNRKTIIIEEEAELDVEDLIASEENVITISNDGYIKRLQVDVYKRQKRGGKGVIAATTKEEDTIRHLFTANTHDYIMFFTNKGKAHWMKVYQIPEAGRQAKGTAVVNLLKLDKEEKITTYIPVKNFSKGYLLFCTRKGIVKKCATELFANPRKGGIIAISLDNDDMLVNVELTNGNQQMIIATANGQAVKFHEKDIRAMGRTAAGVVGIKLKDNDYVIGMEPADDNKSLLTITENGYGKRSAISDYRLISRGGSGVINIICSDRNGKVVEIKAVNENDEILLISKNGIAIRIPMKDISIIGRNTQGVRLMKLEEGDKLVAATKIVRESNDNNQ